MDSTRECWTRIESLRTAIKVADYRHAEASEARDSLMRLCEMVTKEEKRHATSVASILSKITDRLTHTA